jgi:hypothetical protein
MEELRAIDQDGDQVTDASVFVPLLDQCGNGNGNGRQWRLEGRVVDRQQSSTS